MVSRTLRDYSAESLSPEGDIPSNFPQLGAQKS